MTAYVDTSVLMRKVLSERAVLPEWPRITRAITSELARIECLRVLDRMRTEGRLPESSVPRYRADVVRLFEGIHRLGIAPTILERITEPIVVPLGTLDAVHLATVLAWSEGRDERPVVATHDAALARAARAYGFEVIGSPARA